MNLLLHCYISNSIRRARAVSRDQTTGRERKREGGGGGREGDSDNMRKVRADLDADGIRVELLHELGELGPVVLHA